MPVRITKLGVDTGVCFTLVRVVIIFIHVLILIKQINSAYIRNIRWEPLSRTNFSSIVPSGRESGRDQFIVKLKIDGNTYHGRYTPNYRQQKPQLSYGFKGKEIVISDSIGILKLNVEVLSFPKGILQWILVEGSRVPIWDMIPGGYITGTKDVAYICRIFINSGLDDVLTGLYQDGEGSCFSYHGGKKVKDKTHEVLVLSLLGKALNAAVPSIKKM